MANVAILGTGSYLPGKAISNDELATAFGREVAWLAEMLGARSRFLAIDPHTRELRPGQSNARMAAEAARRAIADADIDPRSIDLVVMATCTPDYPFPATVLFVQELLGLPACCVLELRAGCGGTAQAFMIARHLIAGGAARRALLIGSELLSPFVSLFSEQQRDDKDLLVSVAMFGDGAGAVVLGADDATEGVLDARSWSISTGRPAAMLLRTGGALAMGGGHRGADREQEPMFVHDFRAIIEHGPDLMRSACDWLVNEGGHDPATVDIFVPPQVSSNLTATVAKSLGIAEEKVVSDFARVANTVSASIYVALDRLRRDGTLRPGHTVVLLPAEATKWIYGAVVLRWSLEAP